VHVFEGHSGSTATCDHSHEPTPRLLEFKTTGVFVAFMPSTSSWKTTSVVVGPPSMVYCRDLASVAFQVVCKIRLQKCF